MVHESYGEVTKKGGTSMGKNEKISEAQEVLDWVIMHLNLSIKCKVVDYKHGNYRVQVFKGDRLIMPIQVSEEWVEKSNPKENSVSDNLMTLFSNLENY